MTDQDSNDRNSTSEPDADANAGFDYYEYDQQRKKMIKETLGVEIILSQVRYMGADGQFVTESYTDYTRRVLISRYPTIESFLAAWFEAPRKQTLVAALYHQGIFMDMLQEQVGMDLDMFDLVCQLAFDRKPRTRRQRADKVRSTPGYFDKYDVAARRILDVVIRKFSEDGFMTLDKMMDDVLLKHALYTPPFDQFESRRKVFHAFGGKRKFRAAMHELQALIYQD